MTRTRIYAFGIGVLGWMGMMLAAAPGVMAGKSGVTVSPKIQGQEESLRSGKSQAVKATSAQCQALAKMRGVNVRDLKGDIKLNADEAGKLKAGVGDGGVFKGDGGVYTYCNGGLMSK